MNPAADAPFVTRANARFVSGALALGVHALFVLLLVFGVSWQTQHPAPVMVDVWQTLPAAAPPVAVKPPEPVKPAPAPRPAPTLKPAPVPKPVAEEPPPKAPDIALEKKKAEAERLKKLHAIQAAEDRAREESARAEASAIKQARDKQVAEQKRQDLLRQMEADELKQSMAEETAANAARAAQAAAGKNQAALAQAVGQYRDLISAKVRGNTRLPDNLKGNPQVRCLVKLLPTGEVVSVRVTQSSGNAAYDEAVVRAIEKSSPLPLPAERDARAAFVPELLFTHRPKD
jgi:colicin import membrane protein